MTPERTDEAAAILLRNWGAGTRIDALPEDCRPRDRAEGYGIAAALARQSGDTVAGWKIAATSEAGQKHINVDGPLAGRILKGRLVLPGGTIPLGSNLMRVAEAEFAFVLGKAMPARGEPYSQAEVMEAVSALRLSIEVPDSRYADFTKVGAPSLIADMACPSWLMLGPAVEADWRGIDLSTHRVTAFKNGAEAAVGQRQGGARRSTHRAHLAGQRGRPLRRRGPGGAVRHHRHLRRPSAHRAGRYDPRGLRGARVAVGEDRLMGAATAAEAARRPRPAA